MSTNRIIRIAVGLALIGYGVYSGNAWFYLGLMPLLTGLINWCPLEMKMGTCDPASGCCATPTAKKSEEACCAMPSQTTAPKDIGTLSFSTNKKGKIEILGKGRKKCKVLEIATKEAVKGLDADYEVIKVEDIQEIMSYGVTSTPVLVINGVITSIGKSLTVYEITEYIKEADKK